MIAIWYAVVSFMLIIYIVLDGRNFGAGMLQCLSPRLLKNADKSSLRSGRYGHGMRYGSSVSRNIDRDLPAPDGVGVRRLLSGPVF